MMRSPECTLSEVKPVGLARHLHEGRHIHCTAGNEALGPLIDWAKAMGGF
jgi:hypothetical protein